MQTSVVYEVSDCTGLGWAGLWRGWPEPCAVRAVCWDTVVPHSLSEQHQFYDCQVPLLHACCITHARPYYECGWAVCSAPSPKMTASYGHLQCSHADMPMCNYPAGIECLHDIHDLQWYHALSCGMEAS